jgi:hypothetical protein
MELDQFIADTLTNVQKGLATANSKIKDTGEKSFIMNSGDQVTFDVALTVNDENGGKVGGGIRIAGIGLGSDLETKSTQGSISHIKFSVKCNFNQFG